MDQAKLLAICTAAGVTRKTTSAGLEIHNNGRIVGTFIEKEGEPLRLMHPPGSEYECTSYYSARLTDETVLDLMLGEVQEILRAVRFKFVNP